MLFLLLHTCAGVINVTSAEYDAMSVASSNTSIFNCSVIFKNFSITEKTNLFNQGRNIILYSLRGKKEKKHVGWM